MKNVLILLLLLVLVGCAQKDANENIGYKGGEFWSTSKYANVYYNRAVATQSHMIWGTGNHTSAPVPVGAVGPSKYTNQLNGIYQNTKIAEVVKQAVKNGDNVIYVIGDGMGVNHMMLSVWMRMADKRNVPTYFEKIMNEGTSGYSITSCENGVVTGSAAAGTALACGKKTLIGMVGVDSKGNELESALTLAKKRGMATGLISDAHIVDATPAAFYGHAVSRTMLDTLAFQLAESNIDVMFGGGASYFIPKGKKLSEFSVFSDFAGSYEEANSNRNDDKDLIKKLQDKGYLIINTRNELLSLPNNSKKVAGFFAPKGMNAVIDRDEEMTGEPAIPVMVSEAIDILKKNKKGFFLMTECARIDWEAHANDGGAVYKAVEEMNDVLRVAYDFYSKNKKNTLVVFTADHETGGMGIGYTIVPDDKKYTKTLPNGEVWSSRVDPLEWEEYRKIKRQDKKLSRIFSESKNAYELETYLNDNLGYKVSVEDAKVIYEALKNYNSYK